MFGIFDHRFSERNGAGFKAARFHRSSQEPCQDSILLQGSFTLLEQIGSPVVFPARLPEIRAVVEGFSDCQVQPGREDRLFFEMDINWGEDSFNTSENDCLLAPVLKGSLRARRSFNRNRFMAVAIAVSRFAWSRSLARRRVKKMTRVNTSANVIAEARTGRRFLEMNLPIR